MPPVPPVPASMTSSHYFITGTGVAAGTSGGVTPPLVPDSEQIRANIPRYILLICCIERALFTAKYII